jgi:hypothetical protein
VMPKKIIKEFITKQSKLMEIRLVNNNISGNNYNNNVV